LAAFNKDRPGGAEMILILSLLNVFQAVLGFSVLVLWVWVISIMTNIYLPVISDFFPHSSLPLLLLTAILTVAFLLVWTVRERIEKDS
jgi:hypothetical protein